MEEFHLPKGKKAFFLSDLHLGASYFKSPRQAEMRVVKFLDSIAADAGVIFLVGDILDYWYEYRYVVPRGFVRFFGKIAQLADDGVKIVWLIGNHDIWIFDYIPSELGVTVIDGKMECKINGVRFFISHGDDIDDGSKSFKLLRRLFRNKTCQKLFAAIHPRWTIPFALGWSKNSRGDNCQSENSVTPDNLVSFAKETLNNSPDIKYFIFGHLHIIYEENVSAKSKLIILGEWIEKCSYAVYDGEKMDLLSFTIRK